MAYQTIDGATVRDLLGSVERAMKKLDKVSYVTTFRITKTGKADAAAAASVVTHVTCDVDSADRIAHVVVSGSLPTGSYSSDVYFVKGQQFVKEPDGWRKSAVSPDAERTIFFSLADMDFATSPVWEGKTFQIVEGGPKNTLRLETTISGAEIQKAMIGPGGEAVSGLDLSGALMQLGIDKTTHLITELKISGSGASSTGGQDYDYHEEVAVVVHPHPADYQVALPAQVASTAGTPGLETLAMAKAGGSECWCTGCAACAACVACAACISCIACIFPPALAPVTAAAAGTAIAASTAVATSASVGIATAIQKGQ